LSTNQDSASCTRPKAEAICISSPSWIAPLKKRGAIHHEGEHHGGLVEADGEPGQALLRLDQRQVVAQHRAEMAAELALLDRLAAVERDRLAVLAHPHQVVAEVGLALLLREVQADQRPTDVVRQHAADQRVDHRHPDHEAGDVPVAAVEREAEAARQAPQDADEARQRDAGVEQAHAQAHGRSGEHAEVLLDALVRVVGQLGVLAREAHQLEPVEGLAAEPALHHMRGHPGAPADLEQLGQVEAVDRDQDVAESETGEARELLPEHLGILVLQRVVEDPVPLVDQHQHVDRAQVERDDGRQQAARLPFLVGAEVGG
jgi:hypothetical protein